MRTLTDYIKSSFEELKKVVWPTREQAIKLTIIVITVSLVLGSILAGLDMVWRFVLKTFIFQIP